MILALFAACGTPIDQPIDIAWDHAACDQCAMLISDPSFSAQLVTRDGERFEFDDPACVFHFIADRHPSIGNVWFRDHGSQDWLPWSTAGFVPAKGAPMDGGFAAVPAGTAGAVSFGAASGAVLSGAK